MSLVRRDLRCAVLITMAIAPISPISSAALQHYPLRAELTKVEKERLPEAVAKINQASELGDSNELRISTDEATHRIVVHIVNRTTDEVVRQIPPKYVLQIAAELSKPKSANPRLTFPSGATIRSA